MTSPLLHDIIQTDEYDCRYIMSVKIDPPSEVDLLVAGAGPAGMAAALVASLEGLDVLRARSQIRSAVPARPQPARFGFPETVRAVRLATATARNKRTAI